MAGETCVHRPSAGWPAGVAMRAAVGGRAPPVTLVSASLSLLTIKADTRVTASASLHTAARMATPAGHTLQACACASTQPHTGYTQRSGSLSPSPVKPLHCLVYCTLCSLPLPSTTTKTGSCRGGRARPLTRGDGHTVACAQHNHPK